MIAYYEESNGKFLAVDTATNRYYRENFGQDHFEGRATAIAGLVGSVCTTGIPRHQLGDAKLLFQPGLGVVINTPAARAADHPVGQTARAPGVQGHVRFLKADF